MKQNGPDLIIQQKGDTLEMYVHQYKENPPVFCISSENVEQSVYIELNKENFIRLKTFINSIEIERE